MSNVLQTSARFWAPITLINCAFSDSVSALSTAVYAAVLIQKWGFLFWKTDLQLSKEVISKSKEVQNTKSIEGLFPTIDWIACPNCPLAQ